jgi:hypothetical protein
MPAEARRISRSVREAGQRHELDHLRLRVLLLVAGEAPAFGLLRRRWCREDQPADRRPHDRHEDEERGGATGRD